MKMKIFRFLLLFLSFSKFAFAEVPPRLDQVTGISLSEYPGWRLTILPEGNGRLILGADGSNGTKLGIFNFQQVYQQLVENIMITDEKGVAQVSFQMRDTEIGQTFYVKDKEKITELFRIAVENMVSWDLPAFESLLEKFPIPGVENVRPLRRTSLEIPPDGSPSPEPASSQIPKTEIPPRTETSPSPSPLSQATDTDVVPILSEKKSWIRQFLPWLLGGIACLFAIRNLLKRRADGSCSK